MRIKLWQKAPILRLLNKFPRNRCQPKKNKRTKKRVLMMVKKMAKKMAKRMAKRMAENKK